MRQVLWSQFLSPGLRSVSRRFQALWAASPNKQGSAIALGLSVLSAMLLCACGGFTVTLVAPHAAASAQGLPRAQRMAGAAAAAHLVVVATPTATPQFPSTEVIVTPSTAPGTPTPTPTPTSTATPTRPTATPSQPTATPSQPTASPSQPTATPAQPTATPALPAATPTPTPTPTPTSAGPAVLGGMRAAFVAQYGQPTDNSDPNVGRLQFQRYPGSNIDAVIVQLDIYDGATVADRAYSISAQHAPNAPWSQSEAQTTCRAFLPADARFSKRVTVSGATGVEGVDDIYTSATLAGIFPASAFVDAAQKRVRAGTFDLHYSYAASNDGSRIESCQLEIGSQQAPVTVPGNG